MYLLAKSHVSAKVPTLMLMGAILGTAALWTTVVLVLHLAHHPPSFLAGHEWPRVPFAALDVPLWWHEAYLYLRAAAQRLTAALRGNVRSIEDCELGPLPSPPPASSSPAIGAPSASSLVLDTADVLIVKTAENVGSANHTMNGVSATNTGGAPWDLFAAATPSASSVFEGTAQGTAVERQMGTGIAY